MRVLVEGEWYKINDLETYLDDASFYETKGVEGIISHVGYYHSFKRNELVYFLPKVFIFDNGKVLGKYTVTELADNTLLNDIKRSDEYNWIRQLLVIFYNSLLEYRRRKCDTSILREDETFELNTNVGDKEYTYLDLFLSFVNFHKKNRRAILFRYVSYLSNQSDKVNWARTVRKTLPLINQKGQPIYTQMSSKKKMINYEEELLTIFYSILNHFAEEHKMNLDIDKSYKIEKGKRFESLQRNGISRLRKIKHRYFSDLFKRIYQLCELYLSSDMCASTNKKRNEFITVKNYNLVFEDMVDKLLSDSVNEGKQFKGQSISSLKNNKDGKIIDHLFEHTSIIDTDDTVFYIGDSKYYKTDNHAGKISKYKQFTYAKNIIQFNIDLWNKGETYSTRMRYRDDITEGYNISPNFFIYGYIEDNLDFEEHYLERKGDIVKNCHFKDRLFDRDTLFVHPYKMNFLYILKSYTRGVSSERDALRKEVRKTFRDEFVGYFMDSAKCGYELRCKDFDSVGEMKIFVDGNFRLLNGKCYSKRSKLIIAVGVGDDKIETIESYDEFMNLDLN